MTPFAAVGHGTVCVAVIVAGWSGARWARRTLKIIWNGHDYKERGQKCNRRILKSPKIHAVVARQHKD
jgi:hypothetical protein